MHLTYKMCRRKFGRVKGALCMYSLVEILPMFTTVINIFSEGGIDIYILYHAYIYCGQITTNKNSVNV
jgi:hypothetical protein